MTKPYVCPSCFQPSPDTDARGACPVCGHSTAGARLLLWFVLAIFLIILVVGALPVLWIVALTS